MSKARGTLEEIKSFTVEIGMPPSDGESCFYKWEGNGWKNGTSAIKDWKATIRSWKASGYLPSQKTATGFTKPQGTLPLSDQSRTLDANNQPCLAPASKHYTDSKPCPFCGVPAGVACEC